MSTQDWEQTPTSGLLWFLSESTEIDDIQYIQPALPPGQPIWLTKEITRSNLGVIKQMLESLYHSRTNIADKSIVYHHLVMVYGLAQTPQEQRISMVAAPPAAPAVAPAAAVLAPQETSQDNTALATAILAAVALYGGFF